MKADALLILEALMGFQDSGRTLTAVTSGDKVLVRLIDNDGSTIVSVTTDEGYVNNPDTAQPPTWDVPDEHLEAGFPEDGPLAPISHYVQHILSSAAERHQVDINNTLEGQELKDVYAFSLRVLALFHLEAAKGYKEEAGASFYITLENPFSIEASHNPDIARSPDAAQAAVPLLDTIVTEHMRKLYGST